VDAPQPVPIVVYHSISVEQRGELGPYSLSPALFEAHMAFLAEDGYTTYSISELVEAMRAGSPLPPKAVAVTFDDGFGDFRSEAAPVLRRHGIEATLYVTSGHVGTRSSWLSRAVDRRPVLDRAELDEMAHAGVELGAHSVTHPELDLLPAGELRDEIRRCKVELEDLLGRPIRSFAYPFGYYNRRVRAHTIAAGYTSACAVDNVVGSSRSDRYALPRIAVLSGTTVEQFAALVRGAPTHPARPKQRAVQLGWRLYRRARPRRERASGVRVGTAHP
jgi:O-antigen biosynthesis protein